MFLSLISPLIISGIVACHGEEWTKISAYLSNYSAFIGLASEFLFKSLDLDESKK